MSDFYVEYSNRRRVVNGVDFDADVQATHVECRAEFEMKSVPPVGYDFSPTGYRKFCGDNWGPRPLAMSADELLLALGQRGPVFGTANIIFDGGIAGAVADTTWTPHPTTCPPGYVDGGNADTGIALPIGCGKEIVDGGVATGLVTYDGADFTVNTSVGSKEILDGGNFELGIVGDSVQIIADGGEF